MRKWQRTRAFGQTRTGRSGPPIAEIGRAFLRGFKTGSVTTGILFARKTHQECFTDQALVSWLVSEKIAPDVQVAIRIGRELCASNLFRPLNHDKQFSQKNNNFQVMSVSPLSAVFYLERAVQAIGEEKGGARKLKKLDFVSDFQLHLIQVVRLFMIDSANVVVDIEKIMQPIEPLVTLQKYFQKLHDAFQESNFKPSEFQTASFQNSEFRSSVKLIEILARFLRDMMGIHSVAKRGYSVAVALSLLPNLLSVGERVRKLIAVMVKKSKNQVISSAEIVVDTQIELIGKYCRELVSAEAAAIDDQHTIKWLDSSLFRGGLNESFDPKNSKNSYQQLHQTLNSLKYPIFRPTSPERQKQSQESLVRVVRGGGLVLGEPELESLGKLLQRKGMRLRILNAHGGPRTVKVMTILLGIVIKHGGGSCGLSREAANLLGLSLTLDSSNEASEMKNDCKTRVKSKVTDSTQQNKQQKGACIVRIWQILMKMANTAKSLGNTEASNDEQLRAMHGTQEEFLNSVVARAEILKDLCPHSPLKVTENYREMAKKTIPPPAPQGQPPAPPVVVAENNSLAHGDVKIKSEIEKNRNISSSSSSSSSEHSGTQSGLNFSNTAATAGEITLKESKRQLHISDDFSFSNEYADGIAEAVVSFCMMPGQSDTANKLFTIFRLLSRVCSRLSYLRFINQLILFFQLFRK